MRESGERNQPILSAAGHAYQYIKKGIYRGRFPAGSTLNINEIANNLSVSRTPVREAILKLASEGLVEVEPRKKSVVAEMSVQDLYDLYTVRLGLEQMACPLIIENISDRDVDHVQHLVNEATELYDADEDNYDKMRSINREFHENICSATGNKYLSRVLMELLDMSWRYIRPSLEVKRSMVYTLEGHKRIAEALKKRDVEDLQAAVEFDLNETMRVARILLGEKDVQSPDCSGGNAEA